MALAKQMNLPMAEVYEVASFITTSRSCVATEAQAPRLVLRVCDSLSCSMAGARELLDALPARLQAAGQGDDAGVGRALRGPLRAGARGRWCTSALCRKATLDSVLETVTLKPNRALALHPSAPAAINFDVAALAGTAYLRSRMASARAH